MVYGRKIPGYVFVSLPFCVITRWLDTEREDQVCSRPKAYFPGLDGKNDRYEDDASEVEEGVIDSGDEEQDFTACSIDDCGYCGKCMY